MEKKSLQNIEQLQGLIATLDYQETVKKDYISPSTNLIFLDGNLLVTREDKQITYQPTPMFHAQVAEKLGIPKGYYDKMLTDSRKLLDENVNHWMKAESKNMMIRTFEDGAKEFNTARALLSDRFAIIDNYQILMETLQAIKETGVHIEVVEAQLSEKKMYLKVVAPEVEIDAKKLLSEYRKAIQTGSGIIAGFTLSNSEIGFGAFNLKARALVLACNNGATINEDNFRNIHLGGKMDQLGFEGNKEVVRKNLQLIKEQVKHAIKTFLSKEYLLKIVNRYTELGDKPIVAPVDKVIEVVAKEYSITEERRANLLKYFIEGGDTRRIGLASAMTFEAQGLDPDLKDETETASFNMLQNFDRLEAQAAKLSNN